jgi:hypothetical protein
MEHMNLKTRLEALEQRLKDPLDAEIESLLGELLSYEDGAAILEQCLREIESRIERGEL